MVESQDSLLVADNSTEVTPWYGESNKELVSQKGWKSGDDVCNSYRELESALGGRVKMPTPESSAEEIRAFYQRTGCPENREGYEIKAPESVAAFRSEDVENAMKDIAYEQGVSKQAFESIVNGYYDRLAEDMVKSREAGEAELKQELGDKYDEGIKIAQRFCGTCSDEFRTLLEQSGLGNNPIFIKEFIAKGKQTMADSLVRGGSGGEEKPDYVPTYKDSPGMYATGEDEESKKARAYFTARGHKY